MAGNSAFANRYPPLQKSFVGKRATFKDRKTQALPSDCASGKRHVGIFTGRAIEVADLESVRNLHGNGCFGISSVTKATPLVLKQDPNEDRQEKLLLFPEEAFFLCFSLKCLEIRTKDGTELKSEDCLQEFTRIHPEFISSFVAYTYLRTKNWVVKSGIKFGGDFLVYRRGPEFFHATYTVQVRTKGQSQAEPVQLQSINRVSQTSGKDVLFLEVTPRPEDRLLDYLQHQFRSFQVTEMIPRRFILK